MGQVIRIMTYDRAANEQQAITALTLLQHTLSWYRLDDGVMGGQSTTKHHAVQEESIASTSMLHFTGIINTNGGGFTSIRAKLPTEVSLQPTPNTVGIRIRYCGDGKTYKFIMANGNRNVGSPMSPTPSWQADIPTHDHVTDLDRMDDKIWEEIKLPFASFFPSYGGGSRRFADMPQQGCTPKPLLLQPSDMREIGFMLSLRLSNGDPNPEQTFGKGIFPFSLHIQSIETYEDIPNISSTYPDS